MGVRASANKAGQDRMSRGEQLAELAYRSRRRLATALAIVIACILAYHVTFGPNGLTIYQRKRNEDRALQRQILALQKENGQLQEHIEHLKSDPDAIEHEAHVILHYARPGEVIYTLKNQPATDSKSSLGAPPSR